MDCPDGYVELYERCIENPIITDIYPIKTKRQELIDKCDFYLSLIEFAEKHNTKTEYEKAAQIATAYCTRALLEDK